MIENLPNWIDILFLITSIITILFFHYANGKPKIVTSLIIFWSIIQCCLAYSGFYLITDTIPPRFALAILPSTFLIIYGLFPKPLKWASKNRNIKWSTFLHTVRIPVEIVLLYLFFYKMVPELMTFEGRNFDILAGLTAPIIGLLYLKNKISKQTLLIWNMVGLLLVLFILVNGILSAELPFQQFGFEQPNRALGYFPYILLPSTIVPLVIYTHLSDILLLIKNKL